MISPADRAVQQEVAGRVREHYPQARVLAYGSRARGDAEADSDLDICVILESSCPEAEALVRQIAWKVGFDCGLLISTVVLGRDEIEGGPLQASPFVANVLREGILA